MIEIIRKLLTLARVRLGVWLIGSRQLTKMVVAFKNPMSPFQGEIDAAFTWLWALVTQHPTNHAEHMETLCRLDLAHGLLVQEEKPVIGKTSAREAANALFETIQKGFEGGVSRATTGNPYCTCDMWDRGRTLGFIRKTLGGYSLIGWRYTRERLEAPEAHTVNESLFIWCPWCGHRARQT